MREKAKSLDEKAKNYLTAFYLLDNLRLMNKYLSLILFCIYPFASWGECLGNCQNGFGVFTFSNGDEYRATLKMVSSQAGDFNLGKWGLRRRF